MKAGRWLLKTYESGLSVYKIKLADPASQSLNRIFFSDKKLYSRLIAALADLSMDPFIGKKLRGDFKGDYSLRVGQYRILYAIHQMQLLVLVFDLGHRKDIYN